MRLSPDLLALFTADLDTLVAPDARVGIAVSGGPDSLALLLLAHHVRPGLIEAATVDHALRAGSAEEAQTVAETCAQFGIPHSILTARWLSRPVGNVQARARAERYALLGEWAAGRGLAAVATAHHGDDQAETLLMRLGRAAGVTGLSGIRPVADLPGGPSAPAVKLIRPLLGWRRSTLGQIVEQAGVKPVADPANEDERHDRTRVRRWMAGAQWADVPRLASTATYLREADEALEWALKPLLGDRLSEADGAIALDPRGLPRELQRRLLLAALARLGAAGPRGPDLSAALDRMVGGETTTLAGLKLQGGATWRVGHAPPRRPA